MKYHKRMIRNFAYGKSQAWHNLKNAPDSMRALSAYSHVLYCQERIDHHRAKYAVLARVKPLTKADKDRALDRMAGL